MEDYESAIKEYKIVVAQGEKIPEGLEVTTLYTLAQLSFVNENYQDAIDYMETWLSKDDHIRIIDGVGSPAVQVYYDTANSNKAGYDIYQEIRQLGRKHICEVHCKENGALLGQAKMGALFSGFVGLVAIAIGRLAGFGRSDPPAA